MEETVNLTAQTAEQLLELLQLLTLRHYPLILPEHIARLQQRLESSRCGRGDLLSNYSILLRILSFLVHAEIPPTMSELGVALDTPLSSTTRIVDCLVCANIIERVDDPHDRRLVRVRLTADGREIYHTGMDFNKQQLMKLLAIYTPEEQAQLLRLMSKLADYIPAEK